MWPFTKTLSEYLSPTKMVKANGIKFRIKKLQVINHLEGLNCLIETYATYERKRDIDKLPQKDLNKILENVKNVYSDIFLSSVIWPKLCKNRGEDGQCVYDLFGDWELCHALYQQIIDFSTKKKSTKPFLLSLNY